MAERNADSPQVIPVQPTNGAEKSDLLLDLINEVKIANQQLRKLESNTKDGIKEMVWYKHRPDHVKLFVRVSFVSIGDIDAVKQEFQCEFYLNVRWTEPLLKGKKHTDDVDWDSAWEPGVYFIDVVNYDIYERNQQLRPSSVDTGVPDVIQYFHIKGTFKEVLEVNNFPFDYQDLTLVLTANLSVKQVTLLKDPKRDDNIRTWNFTARQEWDLQPHVLTQSTQSIPEEGASKNIFPLYQIRLHVMRQYGFYIYNVAIIMCLITALTFSAFSVKVDSVGDRIQITLTLLLTSVAFKYYVQQFVPTVSYLTLMDKYLLCCMVFQFAMAIHNSVSGMITNSKSLHYFEWIVFGTSLSVFVLYHLVFGMLSIIYLWQAKRQIIKDRQEYKDTNTENRDVNR